MGILLYKKGGVNMDDNQQNNQESSDIGEKGGMSDYSEGLNEDNFPELDNDTSDTE